MFWHTLAYNVTHTSVAQTKQIIGRSEFVDWLAWFELKHEAEKKAADEANRR